MKKIIYLFAATLVLTAAGCDKQSTNENEVQYISELRVNFEGDTRLSATHDASGLKFQWSDGDGITIFEDNNTEAAFKEYYYDAEIGAFIPSTENYIENPYLEVGEEYFAVFYDGFRSDYRISVKDGKSVIWTELEPDEGLQSLPMITDVFKVTAEGAIATLHHIAGVVEIPVKAAKENTSLRYLALNSQTSDVPMTGRFDVSPEAPYTHTWDDDEKIYASEFWAGDSEYSYIDLSTEETTSLFIPVLPGRYSHIDIEYKLWGDDEKIIDDINHELVVERGKITKISTITLEKSF